MPLPRRRSVGEVRPAGGQARPAARRRRHPAPAAHRRRREGARDDDVRRRRSAPRRRSTWGVVDELVEEGKLREGAIAFAREARSPRSAPLKKVRDRQRQDRSRARPARRSSTTSARPTRASSAASRRRKYNIRCVEAAVNLPFDEGMKVERKLFVRADDADAVGGAALRILRRAPGRQDPRRAGRHADAADQEGRHHRRRHHGRRHRHELRQRRHPGDDRRDRSRTRSTAASAIIRRNYERTAKQRPAHAGRGRERAWACSPARSTWTTLADCDLVIEAVFEHMDIKKEVFAQARRDRQAGRDPGHQHLVPRTSTRSPR